MRLPSSWKRLGLAALALAAAASFGAGAASAAVLLDVGGADQAITIQPGQAAAVSFSLDKPVTNFTVSAPVLCLGCSGGVWLQEGALGSTASFAGAIDAHALNGSTTQPYFTASTLDPGLYFLVVSVAADSAGAAIWSGSSSGALRITGDGAFAGLDFLASSTQPFVPFSNFQVAFGDNLNFTVDGALPVPEPSTWILMILGVGAVGALLRLPKQRSASHAD